MDQQELFPPSVAVLVAQVTYHESQGWSATVATRPQAYPTAFSGWTTYGPMPWAALSDILPELVL